MGNYSYFIIQTVAEYEELLKYLGDEIKKIQESLKKASGYFNIFNSNASLAEKANSAIAKIKDEYFMLLQFWPEGVGKVRIISIYEHKSRTIPGANFCIYFNDKIDDG